jgi:hypothetical protein
MMLCLLLPPVLLTEEGLGVVAVEGRPCRSNDRPIPPWPCWKRDRTSSERGSPARRKVRLLLLLVTWGVVGCGGGWCSVIW